MCTFRKNFARSFGVAGSLRAHAAAIFIAQSTAFNLENVQLNHTKLRPESTKSRHFEIQYRFFFREGAVPLPQTPLPPPPLSAPQFSLPVSFPSLCWALDSSADATFPSKLPTTSRQLYVRCNHRLP